MAKWITTSSTWKEEFHRIPIPKNSGKFENPNGKKFQILNFFTDKDKQAKAYL